jgi:hypothetical protein
MKIYLSKQERADFIIFTHFIDFIPRLLQWEKAGIITKSELTRLKTMNTLGRNLCNDIYCRMNDEYKMKVGRDTKDTELLILTKVRSAIKRAEIKEGESKMVVDEENLFGLTEEALTHCKGCLKEDWSGCVVRNCAMEIQIPAVDPESETCQYRF